MPRIVLVCGPAGGGKSTWAGRLAEERGLEVVATDDLMHLPWDEVPYAVGRRLASFPPDATVVLEGVRALSTVDKLGLAPDVVETWWCEDGPGRPGASGMTTRQRSLLQKLGRRMPPVKRPR